MDTKSLPKRVRSDRVMFINLQFTDMLGSLKKVTTPIRNLRDILTSGAWFDGSSISARIELRCPDPACNPYLSGLCRNARRGS